jgi:nitrite reductase/ring-hydroxylating ferredoxin subunit
MEPLSRRKLVKYLAYGAAVCSVPGKVWKTLLVTEAQATQFGGGVDGVVKLRLSDFPALQEAFGSVRIGPNQVLADDFPEGLIYPLIVSRDETGTFYAVDSECKHASCTVASWSSTSGAITCPCHGSQYAMDGTLLEGPANDNLAAYDIVFDGNDTLTITVQKFGYCVTVRPAATAAGARLRIEIPTFEFSRYGVLSRSSITSEWTPVPFATTPDGPTNQTSLVGNGMPRSVYVPMSGTTGFFSVQLEMSEV